jgi:Tfp pilus assembly protein PilX
MSLMSPDRAPTARRANGGPARRNRARRRSAGRIRRGVTILVVLLLMSVMVLGGMALARMTEIGTLATGNNAAREVSLQASEIGINTAYLATQALASEESNVGTWYWATTQATDANGIPNITWGSAPELSVGSYSVRYAVERLCNTAPVTDTLRQCLVRQVPQISSSRVGHEEVDPPNPRQFRITVRVTGPKDTETWVQTMVSKGSAISP